MFKALMIKTSGRVTLSHLMIPTQETPQPKTSEKPEGFFRSIRKAVESLVRWLRDVIL